MNAPYPAMQHDALAAIKLTIDEIIPPYRGEEALQLHVASSDKSDLYMLKDRLIKKATSSNFDKKFSP